MKNAFLLCIPVLLLSPNPLPADSPVEIARTKGNTLNDLFQRVPVISPAYDKPLRRVSAVQEQLYLYERRMRGEGLPLEMTHLFSRNYGAILDALVDDRISEGRGRELLSIHRQLVEHSHAWSAKRLRNENYPADLMANLNYFHEELERTAIPLFDVPDAVKTPVINGYQAWLGELIAWGESHGTLAAGDLERLRVKADELERFESAYKSDGSLQQFERELLHGRFLHLTRDTIDVVSR